MLILKNFKFFYYNIFLIEKYYIPQLYAIKEEAVLLSIQDVFQICNQNRYTYKCELSS